MGGSYALLYYKWDAALFGPLNYARLLFLFKDAVVGSTLKSVVSDVKVVKGDLFFIVS
jgi:hypothetical protein